jgi:hypothetical protein
MRAPTRLFFLCLCLCAAALAAATTSAMPGSPSPGGQKAATLDTTQPYLFLDAFKKSLEQELNDAAAAGYRVQTAWAHGHSVVLLTKPTGTVNPVQYAVLEGWTAPELEKALAQASVQGYRYVERSIIVSTSNFMNGQGRIRLLVQRTPGAETRYAYSVGVATAEFKPTAPFSPFTPSTASAQAGATLLTEPLDRAVQTLAAGGYHPAALLMRELPLRRKLLSEPLPEIEFIFVGEKAPGDPDALPADQYRVIAGVPGLPLQSELRAAALGGYRLAVTSPVAYPVLVLVVERGRAGTATADYVLAGGDDTLPLAFQLNRAATAGYRIVPGYAFNPMTLAERDPLTSERTHGLWGSAAAVMEKKPDSTTAFEYRVLANGERTEIEAAMADGWVCVSHGRNGMLTVLEKATGQPIATAGEFAGSTSGDVRRIDALRESTLQKKISEAAAAGYRVMRSYFSEPPMLLSMEKSSDPSAPFEYVLVSERGDTKLETAMNDAAAKGFRLVPGQVSSFVGSWGSDTLVVMERAPKAAPPPVRYQVVSAAKLSTFTAELDKARQDGGALVGILGTLTKSVLGGRVAVLEVPGAK